jgi:hypothetical protein
MLKGKITMSGDISGNLSSNERLLDHEYLFNRDSKTAHPIEAIDGLSDRLEKLERTDAILSRDLNRQGVISADLIADEVSRAQVAETALERQIGEINRQLLTVDDGLDEQYLKASEAITKETFDRQTADASLDKKIISVNTELSKTAELVNSHTEEALNRFKTIEAALAQSESLFNNHITKFEDQASQLSELATTVEYYKEIFNKHLADSANLSNATTVALDNLKQELNSEISNKLLTERTLLESEINELESTFTSKLSSLKTELTTLANQHFNNAKAYTNSEIEKVTKEISELHKSFEAELSRVSADLEQDINQAKTFITAIDTRLQELAEVADKDHTELAARIDSAVMSINSVSNTVKEQIKTFNDTISDIYFKITNTENNLQELRQDILNSLNNIKDGFQTDIDTLKDNLDTSVEELSNLIVENCDSLTEKIEDTNLTLIENITEVNNTLSGQVELLEKHYKEADASILDLATKHADGLASQITTNYEAQDSQIIQDFKDADAKTLDDAQEFTETLVSGLENKLKILENWKSAISNVLDFVGITTTDISKHTSKFNATVKINNINHIATKGDVILYNNKEYVWTGGEEGAQGWEEIGIGSANEAAIAALQQLVGTDDAENPSGIFKSIVDLQANIENKLLQEIETANKNVDKVKDDLENYIINSNNTFEQFNTNITNIQTNISTINQDLTKYWLKPNSLIFTSKDIAISEITNNLAHFYVGQLISIKTGESADDVIETYIISNLTPEVQLQLISGGGGGGGTPDKGTETQYCIQVKSGAEYAPEKLEDFYNADNNKIIIIELPKPKRKNNLITTIDHSGFENITGGYIYYASQLDNLKFTSAGFDAGFTKIISADSIGSDAFKGYNIYRTNQKIIDVVEITIN